MALRAGYYGVKRALKDKLSEIAGVWDTTIASLFPRNEQAVLGVKNVYPILLSEIKSLFTGGTWSDNVYTLTNGGTITANLSPDGSGYVESLTINGTFGSNFTGALTTVGSGQIPKHVPVDGKYIFNGVTGGSASKYGIIFNYFPTMASAEATLGTFYDGDSAPLNINKAWFLKPYVQIKAGTYSNIIIKPMLRMASDPDDTFAPYAMTNQALTASAADQKTTINAIISAATGAADFAAFKAAIEAITPVTRSLSMAAAPEEIVKDEIEEPVVEKKTTRKKSTVKADTKEEV